MKVSVVIRTYNRARLLPDAVKTALGQSRPPDEVLIVDDGSSDGTREVVAAFDDPRIRYIAHETNRGCAAAGNTGFRECRGDLIAMLDSDDWWKPEKLARQVDFLNRHPEADAVFSDAEKYDGAAYFPSFMAESPVFYALLRDVGMPPETVFTARQIYLCLLSEVPIKLQALLMRRRIPDSIGGFDENRRAGSDWEFFLRCAKRFRFGYMHEPLTVIRVQPDAVHRLYAESDKTLLLRLLRDERGRTRQDAEALAAIRGGIISLSKHLAWHYQRQGRPAQAARVSLRALCDTGRPEFALRAIVPFLPARLVERAKGVLGRESVSAEAAPR